jgi:hypothetical protein
MLVRNVRHLTALLPLVLVVESSCAERPIETSEKRISLSGEILGEYLYEDLTAEAYPLF